MALIARSLPDDIGRRNTEAVDRILDELGIPVVATDVGGSQGRSVEFRIDTGELFVRTIRGETKAI